MRRIKRLDVVTALLLAQGLTTGLTAKPVTAESAAAPSLVISQLKVTSSNGQFVTLYNATDAALDMSHYQLEYFNNFDLAKATSSKLVALSGSLPPHGYFMVSDDNLPVCYRLSVDSVSLGWSSTAGLVEVLALGQVSPGGSVSPTLLDFVGWSKAAAAGAQTLPASTAGSLLRQPRDAANGPAITSPGEGAWAAVQPATTGSCDVVAIGSDQSLPLAAGSSYTLPVTPPPAITITPAATAGDSDSTAVNSGLVTPQLTELLPNPAGSGTDASDEFIELYNANTASFNLSGYGLQVGTGVLHNFIFPAGSSLPPLSFTAFYSSYTGLSLSNSGGQARLLDPTGTVISQSGSYGAAKDGQAWAAANGKWSWTTSPSPGSLNVINLPASTKTAAGTSAAKTTKTTTAKTGGSSAKAASGTAVSAGAPGAGNMTPIHSWTLALVAGLALLYGAYEYRTDLGNRIHQLRANLRHRRAAWQPLTWWRSHRSGQ